jgi:hypothetical protein
VLLHDAPLTLRELMTHEPLPLATIFRSVALFLAKRPDAVVFGAHAVNAYCEPERMTQDVGVMSTNAAALAEDLRAYLVSTLHIAARVREIVSGDGFRVYQVRKPKNRHLVDVRQVHELPEHQTVEGVRVIAPAQLIAMKVSSVVGRKGRPKGDTDSADLKRLLLAFPALKTEKGRVTELLRAAGAPDSVLSRWREIVIEPIEPDVDETEGDDE